jgi:hypothetical protein
MFMAAAEGEIGVEAATTPMRAGAPASVDLPAVGSKKARGKNEQSEEIVQHGGGAGLPFVSLDIDGRSGPEPA